VNVNGGVLFLARCLSITPSLHHSITPSLHHSITPLLRYSVLHYSIVKKSEEGKDEPCHHKTVDRHARENQSLGPSGSSGRPGWTRRSGDRIQRHNDRDLLRSLFARIGPGKRETYLNDRGEFVRGLVHRPQRKGAPGPGQVHPPPEGWRHRGGGAHLWLMMTLLAAGPAAQERREGIGVMEYWVLWQDVVRPRRPIKKRRPLAARCVPITPILPSLPYSTNPFAPFLRRLNGRGHYEDRQRALGRGRPSHFHLHRGAAEPWPGGAPKPAAGWTNWGGSSSPATSLAVTASNREPGSASKGTPTTFGFTDPSASWPRSMSNPRASATSNAAPAFATPGKNPSAA